MEKTNEYNKVFQVNDSYGIERSKDDIQSMNLNTSDWLENHVSSDGKSITFFEKEAVDAKTNQIIDDIFHEDADLIEALKDLWYI